MRRRRVRERVRRRGRMGRRSRWWLWFRRLVIELQLKSFYASLICVASLDEFDIFNRPFADLFARGRLS